MRKVIAAVVGAVLLLSLTACGDSEQSIKQEAKLVKICHEQGGSWIYGSGWSGAGKCFFDVKENRNG